VQLLADKLADCAWDKAPSPGASSRCSPTGLKMPQLAMAVRVLLLGTSQTPSLDAVIELFLRETVLERLGTGKL
jgi:glutamyl-tRNA synthetase